MAAAASMPPVLPAESGEERMLVHDVPWSTYVVMRDSLDEQRSKLRLTYCEGALELMSPSDDHEYTKSVFGRLIEAYGDAMDLDLMARGSTTFRKEAEKRGLEPDECYTIGPKGELPDLAIEIVFSRPKLDKLEVYAGLGVPEVWIWQDGRLRAFVLTGDRYEETTQSRIFPALDLALFARFVRIDESQSSLVKGFRAAIEAARRG